MASGQPLKIVQRLMPHPVEAPETHPDILRGNESLTLQGAA